MCTWEEVKGDEAGKEVTTFSSSKVCSSQVGLNMTTNSDERKFDKLVGMLKAEEMETDNNLLNISNLYNKLAAGSIYEYGDL